MAVWTSDFNPVDYFCDGRLEDWLSFKTSSRYISFHAERVASPLKQCLAGVDSNVKFGTVIF